MAETSTPASEHLRLTLLSVAHMQARVFAFNIGLMRRGATSETGDHLAQEAYDAAAAFDDALAARVTEIVKGVDRA